MANKKTEAQKTQKIEETKAIRETKVEEAVKPVTTAVTKVTVDNATVVNVTSPSTIDRIAKEKNIKVFPNSIDTSVFYPRNKDQMREKLGFPKDAYIIAFVGRLLPVKGPDRLSAAIEEITENKPYSFYLGEGPLKPTCGNILFCNTVQHNQAAEYLSAADVFVLPTLAEGCCNAIVEAMACGLPIISSALPFNDDILTDKNSIRVDPMNIKEIADAIVKLRDDEIMRENMSKASLATVQQLTIDNRAKGIISFMNKQIAKKQEE